MVVPSHQSEKLSQPQTMLEAGRAGPVPDADRLELRRLVYALCHASKARGEPLHNTGRVDAAVAALKTAQGEPQAPYRCKQQTPDGLA